MQTYKDRITTYERKMTTTCSLSLSLSLSLAWLSLSNFSASNFRVMGDLLKKFQTITRDRTESTTPTLTDFPPTHERESEIKSPHLDKSRHVSTTVGLSSHSRGRVGRKSIIIYQRIKQEKAYLTSLESQRGPPTVGEGEKRAAHWSDVLNSYEDRTEIHLYCCSDISKYEFTGLWEHNWPF